MAKRLSDPPPEVRFWKQVQKTEDCWNWTGCIKDETKRGGYGTLKVNGKGMRAHRYAYLLLKGPIPPGLVVMHVCDNRRCVNPNHLQLGTNGDNIRDAMSKGRLATGERNGASKYPERISAGMKRYCREHPEARPNGELALRSKLTWKIVDEIRRLYAGNVRKCYIARKFGIGWTTVHDIVNFRTWKVVQQKRESSL